MSRVVLLLGKRGHGKSTKLLDLVEGARPVCVLDPLGEWGPEDFGAVRFDPHDYPGIWDRLAVQVGNVYLRTREQRDKPPGRGKLWAPFELLQHVPDLVLVVDEVDKFTLRTWAPEGFRSIIEHGRHGDQWLYVAARRVASIATVITDEMTDLFYFCTRANVWRTVAGSSGDGWDLEVPRELPKFEYLHFHL